MVHLACYTKEAYLGKKLISERSSAGNGAFKTLLKSIPQGLKAE
jgi:hypothetical protein